MLGRWVNRLIDQASDGPSIILIIENKSVGCWLGLRALKTLYFYFKVIKDLKNKLKGLLQIILQEIILGTSDAWSMRRSVLY